MTGRSKEEYLTLTSVEREEFIAAARRASGADRNKPMTGDSAIAWMASQGS